MKRAVLLLIALTASSCSEATDALLDTPCASPKRVTAEKTYDSLALHMVVRWLPNVDRYPLMSEGDRAQRQVVIARTRAEHLPAVANVCLREHVAKWLDWHRDKVDRMEVDLGRVERDEWAENWAREEAQRRALAEKLGVRP